MLLGTLGTSLLENMLASQRVNAIIQERGVIRAGEGATTTGEEPIKVRQDV